MINNTQYGLFVVKCMNIGDDIQSIAALRFLPEINHYIDRDRLDEVDNIAIEHDQSLQMIMNGWYLGGYEHWPPKSKSLKPLLTSIHINPLQADGDALKKFVSKDGLKFLKKHSPVGARDLSTLKLLQDNNVESYFSACMTLTLNAAENVVKKDYILAVNVSDEMFESIKQKTDRQVIRMDVERTQDTTVEENLAIAKYYLYMYQSAHCVISTRLHATLPTVAIGGKVLFIVEKNGDNADFNDRFSGLYDLVNNMTASEFIADNNSIKYDINNPPDNPKQYMTYRKDLESRCLKYTGYDNNNSYMGRQTIEELITSSDFFSGMTKIAEESWDSFKYKHRWSIPPILYNEIDENEKSSKKIEELQVLINRKLQPGIKTSLKYVIKAILYKLKLINRNR